MRQSKSLIIIGMLGMGLMLSTAVTVVASPGEAVAKSSLEACKIQTIDFISSTEAFTIKSVAAEVESFAVVKADITLDLLQVIKSTNFNQGSENVRKFSNSLTLYKQVKPVPIDISPGAKLYLYVKVIETANLTPKLCSFLTLYSLNRKLESRSKVKFEPGPYVYRQKIPLRV